MTPLEAFLTTMPPMQAAKAGVALAKYTRVNGKGCVRRHEMLEAHIAQGYRVTFRKNGERVFMGPEGSWFDQAAVTKTGLDYAAFLETYGRNGEERDQ